MSFDMGKIVMATGGTGGHIYPALATAQELSKLGYDLSFLGQASGMEARIVPENGYPFNGVRAGKWNRGRPDPRQAIQAFLGLTDAIGTLRRLKPRLVIGFGGFASFPGLAAATLLGIPIILHEGNAFPGRVTRWFASRALLLAASTAEVGKRLKNTRSFVELALPIRENKIARAQARQQLGFDEDDLITLVMGGSQGSLFLNTHLPPAYSALPKDLRQRLKVLHSSGTRWYEQLSPEMSSYSHYHVKPYVEADLAWSAADLAITRAGISTLSEAAFHGVPLIMVPLPSAAENHQLHNARMFANAGAGHVVSENDIASLPQVWQELLAERDRAATAALKLSPEGSARAFAKLIDKTLRINAPGQALQEST